MRESAGERGRRIRGGRKHKPNTCTIFVGKTAPMTNHLSLGANKLGERSPLVRCVRFRSGSRAPAVAAYLPCGVSLIAYHLLLMAYHYYLSRIPGRRERNWEGEQRMVAADTAAWVRSLPDEDLEAAARAGGGVGAQGPQEKAAVGVTSDAPPKRGGKKRAFLKSLLTGGLHPGS